MRAPSLLASSVAVVAGVHIQGKHDALPNLGPVSLVSNPFYSYKSDCWKKRPVAASLLQNPGAGMDKDAIEPFVTVEKDGFMMVDCVKDVMYEQGDKHGDNKFSYKVTSNVSIIHYKDIVPKEDRKPTTHATCFEFCRTVPDMLFFGIHNGRDCYCTPYYQQMASDSSECDSVCDGDNTLMCGGKSKSSIFEMHSCDDTEQDMETSAENLGEAVETLEGLVSHLRSKAEQGEADANTVQESLGKAGDPDGSNLCQESKIYAGELLHSAEDAEEFVDEMKAHMDEVKDLKGLNFKKMENAKKAEKVTKAMKKGIDDTVEMNNKFDDLVSAASPLPPDEDTEEATTERAIKGRAEQYVPIMHLIDSKYEDAPSTCAGDILQIIFGTDTDQCGYECDEKLHPDKCVGFQYFGEGDGICVLFTSFTKAQYFKGCMSKDGGDKDGGDKKDGGKKFLQTSGTKVKGDEPFTAQCLVKEADYAGIALKPDDSGKCEYCLKELTEANRCYE